MKKIYFIRHAKAKKDGETDFLRKLNERGRSNAKDMAKVLKERKISPSAIITSPAVRALSTANIFANEMGFSGKFIEVDRLYEMSESELFEFIKSLNDELIGDEIFIVAHNPTVTEISELLSDSAIGNLPTCAVFGIKFEVEKFSEISAHSGKVELYLYPKRDL